MDLETECLAIENELSQALRDGSLLPTLDRWTLEGVALSLFRDREVPSLKLAHEGRSLVLYLLPAGADEQAFYRTERYDVLYDDDAHSSNYTRCHAVLERLVAWLGATFPADEELRRQELARRRAARMQKLSHDPALVALSDEVSQKLRAALDAGAFTLPEGWRFEESLVEAQQGAAAVAVRFARAQGAFIFRLLATDPARQAYLRTSRFDVLYDSAEGDWQTQDEPLARRFVLWLDEAFPASSAPPAAPPSGDAPRPVRRPATAIDPAMTALARALDQGLSEALGTSALPNPEGWTLKHVAVQEFQGATAVEAVFLLRDRTVIFYVMPTNTENRAFRRTKSLDVLYEGDTEGVHFARDRALIEAVTEWIATWDAARAP